MEIIGIEPISTPPVRFKIDLIVWKCHFFKPKIAQK